MDKLYNEIKKIFGDDYEYVIKDIDNQRSLKFNIILDDENEEKDDDNNENSFNVEVKMFKTNDGYLIRFRKEFGDLYDF